MRATYACETCQDTGKVADATVGFHFEATCEDCGGRPPKAQRPGHVKAQATVRTDGRETVTIKLIGYRPEEIDEMLTDLPDAAIHPIGVARLEARRR